MENQSSSLNRREVVKLAGVLSVAMALGGSRQSASATTAGFPSRQFFHPDRLRYDGRSLILEGKPFFMYSGSFHYYRCAKPLWRLFIRRLPQIPTTFFKQNLFFRICPCVVPGG